jgi:alkylated DNA nucleotide flippase Atl1
MSDSGTARELTPQERAALIAWHLAHGEAMTIEQVAELAGLSVRSACKLMDTLSCVLSINQESRIWTACNTQENDIELEGRKQEVLSPQERAALVAWQLACGKSLTSQHVAELTGLTERGAYDLVSRLARVLPIQRQTAWVVAHLRESNGAV